MKKNAGWKFVVDDHLRAYGETDFDKKVIKINKKKAKKSAKAGVKGELIDGITHEIHHMKNPKASEEATIRATRAKVKRMSEKEKQRLYKLFQK